MSEKKDVSMNEELQRWLKESKDKFESSKKNQDIKGKKPTGLCQLCGKRHAEAVCIKCGRNVCKSCYFKLIGVCKKCVPQDIAGKWDGSRTDWEKKLGVEWVD